MKRVTQVLHLQSRCIRGRPKIEPFPSQKPTKSGILDEGATYADMHNAYTDVVHGVPYKEKDIRLALDKSTEEIVKEKNKKLYSQRKVSGVINFDHIPIEDQCVLLFPGQGAQFVGMGKKVLKFVLAFIFGSFWLSIVKKRNGFSKKRQGPQTKLDQTLYCQPAVFVSSIAAWEKLKKEDEGVSTMTTDVAGFSVGEFAALVAGGMLRFGDALQVVKRRAEAMHKCNQLISAGMVTVQVKAVSRLEDAMRDAREIAKEKHEVAVCEVANFLFCGVKVVGATETCLRFLEDNQQQYKFKILKRLPVSGAFHTPLMTDAVPEVAEELRKVELLTPICNIYSNFVGAVYSARKGEIRNAIAKQVVSPVKWEQIQQLLFRKHKDEKFPRVIEVGPGKQLGTMWAKTSKKAHEKYEHYSC
ncbi:unnamed protein product, partial [Mesorhabditis belari]|uniref:Malonyl-CoA:ACP transacylase (MAT) domain-containing protein n=1 Tax=Mesorhabditis belari TaxID=2138241 RepID=A0AAF3J5Q3_9BILA